MTNIATLRAQGLSFAAIGERLGLTKDQAQKRYKRARRGKAEGPGLESLAPIVMPAPVVPAGAKSYADLAVVASDFHFGEGTHSPECEEIFLSVVRDLLPSVIVLNADLADFAAVSTYPKDARRPGPLSTERRQMTEFFHRLRQVAPSAQIIETNGNHSGDSKESRWWRYLNDRIPEALEDNGVRDALSYPAIWHPTWAKVKLVDHYMICKGLVAIHGDVVRGHSAYSARAMLEKLRHSLIMGHTHRFGYYVYRVPALAGKKEHQMRAYEGGCMCRLDPPYGAGPLSNWQQGFSIVRHAGEDFGVEQVLIHAGKAVCTTLGQVYRASK